MNNVSMRFRFYRSKAGFALLTSAEDVTKYRIDICDAILLCRKTKVSSTVAKSLEKTLLLSNIKIPINRIDVKTISIGQGIQSKSLDNVIIGKHFKLHLN